MALYGVHRESLQLSLQLTKYSEISWLCIGRHHWRVYFVFCIKKHIASWCPSVLLKRCLHVLQFFFNLVLVQQTLVYRETNWKFIYFQNRPLFCTIPQNKTKFKKILLHVTIQYFISESWHVISDKFLLSTEHAIHVT